MTYQKRQEGLLVHDVGDEVLVYDQERDRIHSLNQTTKVIWRQCDGQTSITDMAALLAQELGLPTDEDLVRLALEQLRRAHLLQEPRFENAVRVSRREVLQKLGHVGGLALLLPLISSITAPTPAMAAISPNGGGGIGDGDGGAVCAGRCASNADCSFECSCQFVVVAGEPRRGRCG